jgi:CelD/BcsL family acetyltransferase involved in cellulose biosynthesis
MIQVELLPPDRARAQIAAIWTDLEHACRPSVWLRWGWMETWLDTLPVELRPQLVVVRRGDDPIAAFFVCVTTMSEHRVLRWRRALLNQTGSAEYDVLYIEFNGWVHRPGEDVDLIAVLDRLPIAWDELVMRRLDPATPIALDGIFGRYRVVELARDPSPRVDLTAVRAAKDGYLSLLSKSTRAAIRRARRGYEARGELTLERAVTAAQACAFLDELAALSRRRFAERAGGAFESAYFRSFHEALVERRHAVGELELLRLRAGGQTIGLSYNLLADGVVNFYQSGIRYEDDNRLKPGLLLHAEAIEHFARGGHRIYDFLAGQARYKDELATGAIELRSVRILRNRPVFLITEGLGAARAWARRQLQRR